MSLFILPLENSILYGVEMACVADALALNSLNFEVSHLDNAFDQVQIQNSEALLLFIIIIIFFVQIKIFPLNASNQTLHLKYMI